MAISQYIASKTDLKQYIKERLGEPVVRVEIDDVQLEHVINLAVEKFVEKADDGSSIRFMQLATSAGQQKYVLDTDVYTVKKVYAADGNFPEINAVFPDRYMADNYGANLDTQGGLLSLEISRQRIAELDFYLKVQPIFDYNTTTRTLYLLEPPTSGIVGVLYYEKLDYSEETSSIYDHHWVKRYATELGREQWGVSLTKYEGSMLPSGLTMNPAAMLQKAEQEKEKLEIELQEVYTLPIDYFFG